MNADLVQQEDSEILDWEKRASEQAIDRKVWSLLGMPVDEMSMPEMVGVVDHTIQCQGQLWLSTPNLDWMSLCSRDADFRRSVIASDLSVCDGMPVLWLARMAGIPVKNRVPGSVLFETLRENKSPQARARSVFFLGGHDYALAGAVSCLNQQEGPLLAVGGHNPGYGSVDQMSNGEVLDRINHPDPDMLIVSLSALKGQLWIEKNISNLKARVVAPLGAVLDFTAGTVKCAPALFQRVGLEWLWRSKEDPRLLRRYGQNAIMLPGFIIRCLFIRFLVLIHNSLSWPRSIGETSVSMDTDIRKAYVKLGRVCRFGTLASTRASLKVAIAGKADIEVDFSALRLFDLSLLGLLQVARQRTEMAGRRFVLTGVGPLARVILAFNDDRFEVNPSSRPRITS